MACFGKPCFSVWMLKQSAFVQDPVHLWMATGRKNLTYLLPEIGPFQEIFAGLMTFYFISSLLPPLLSVKDTGFPIPIKWLFWDIILPSSWPDNFPNKVIFLATTPSLLDLLTCHVVSRVSLDSVTGWWWDNKVMFGKPQSSGSSLGPTCV